MSAIPSIGDPHFAHLRAEALAAPASGIVSIVELARGRKNVIPLWVGEGDLATPEFISGAAADALLGGETFYTWQQGLPDLRVELARYFRRHFAVEKGADDFIVTGSGMQAIVLAMQAVAGPGDECIYLSPAWPNMPAALEIAGGRAVPVELDFAESGWTLDIGRLEAAITPRTRALFINTPSNPTGWVATEDTLRHILDLARRHDLWIIADEIYALFRYSEGGRSPSFLDVAGAEDRILYVNSFSKNWAMTGWRMGWIMAAPALMPMFQNLVQYSTSGVPQFLQRGAAVAVRDGDSFIEAQRQRSQEALAIVGDALRSTGRARFADPDGTFYLFFAVDGVSSAVAAAKTILDATGVGLAPGTAFGKSGEGFLRLCFNRDLGQIRDAAERLARFIPRM